MSSNALLEKYLLVTIHRKFYQYERLWNLFVHCLTYISRKRSAFAESSRSFKGVIFQTTHRSSKQMTHTILFYNSRSKSTNPEEIRFPWWLSGKESSCNASEEGSIPGWGRSPGEGNSSILAWRIPWTEEPGELQSMGLQGVRHDLVTYSSSHRTNTIQVLLESVLPGLQS